MTLADLEQFRDGPIHPQERRAALRFEQRQREDREQRQGCRIGRVVDRRSTAERMAEVMARQYRRKGRCMRQDLAEAGFTPQDIDAHQMLARSIAGRMLRDPGV